MNRSHETRLAKLEQVRGARARRYCFYYDEEAEAQAQGLPCILVPRPLSREEWEKKYSLPVPTETKCDRTPSDESLVLSNE
jgi:hypothetical protein